MKNQRMGNEYVGGIKYHVLRRMGAAQNPALDPVVSRHRTLRGAQKSLKRQALGAKRQGGYSTDYIYSACHGATID
jgi:hypothetical protein